MPFRIGVDIGGTFTDFTIVDDRGNVTLWKEDSTPDDPTKAIELGLPAAAALLGLESEDLLRGATQFVHGTTIATNTLIQRSGPTVGLICTDGFRDVIYFRDGFKPERFNVHLPRPPDFVDRYLRLGVSERTRVTGEVVTPLAEDEVRQAADRFREAGVGAVAVAFLWSIVNKTHEQRAAEILREELPNVDVLCSADILPEIREWERTSATVLSAYILPRIGGYLRRLEGLLRESGFERAPLVMQNNGGCASVGEVLERPVNVLASGPAAAPAAASFYADAVEVDDLITVDMGGTSFDVCVIRAGRPAMSRTIQVEHQPIGVPGVEVHSIGAGGGSIAWIDPGGALRVGPRSAGARPGPACYGKEGEEPTVTDANVVLGYLSPDAFLGGRRQLRGDLAHRAVLTKVGEPLGLDAVEAAAGIVEVVNTNMVRGIRAVSIERGIDPRGYLLVSGGGAGGLHAARLARQLEMRRILIPKEAPTLCAFGMTVTDVRHDYTRSFHAHSSDLDARRVDKLFAELEDEARERLRNDGFERDQIQLERLVDARYPNQIHELTIPIPSCDAYSEDDLRDIERRFHHEHKQQFTYAIDDLPVEFLHWRVTGVGRTDVAAPQAREPATDAGDATADASLGEREAYFPEFGAFTPTALYALDRLVCGATVVGPAIIQAEATTVVVNPDDLLTVQGDGSLLIEISA